MIRILLRHYDEGEVEEFHLGEVGLLTVESE